MQLEQGELHSFVNTLTRGILSSFLLWVRECPIDILFIFTTHAVKLYYIQNRQQFLYIYIFFFYEIYIAHLLALTISVN